MMIRISAFLLGTAIGGSIALAQPAANGPVLPPDGFDMTAIDHSTKPEFTYRHRWNPDDLVMWDNRCTMHLAPKDYRDGEPRYMCRTTLIGEPSGRLARDEV